MRLMLLALLIQLVIGSGAVAGIIQGQGRELDGNAIGNVTVTVLRSDGAVLFVKTFRNGTYTVAFPDNSLFANEKSVSILFSSPGRDDARLDNVLGTSNVANLDVILPKKVCAPPTACNSKCRHRCRIFRRR
ncbi:MAG: hypothetical protein J0M17_05175 [Planctomycetes bacterium]|nr:hypothetical protein [Planctomycetota bacterium]